jgi:primosomal protein N' (replication factor Y) (superfamily II helicase)
MGDSPERLLQVAVDTPGLGALSYRGLESESEQARPGQDLQEGDWVLVPVGTRTKVGLVLGVEMATEQTIAGLQYGLKPVVQRLLLPRLPEASRRLLAFTARYYHRSVGQVMGTMLPNWFRAASTHRERALKTGTKPSGMATLMSALVSEMAALSSAPAQATPNTNQSKPAAWPTLTPAQSGVVAAMQGESVDPMGKTFLLQGVTGSGKTRVYLEMMDHILRSAPGRQALLLVPEIGLTPQLDQRLRAAFEVHRIGVLHSGLTDKQRAEVWLAAAMGHIQILVGTRMAILAPLPGLAIIVVDEEHDASYKQLEGVRYSARDLALWRAKDLGIPLLMGSASPSLEMQAQVKQQRITLLQLQERATGAAPAPIRFIDLRVERAQDGLAPSAWRALEETLQEGQQALVYLNRRGWAPVLNCEACGWTAPCADCSTPAVLHKRRSGWRLICHRCGHQSSPPAACPDCGNPGLESYGRGSQQLEEALQQRFPAAALLRIDRDAIPTHAAFEAALMKIRSGTVNLLVGTQMMAKGHDFPALKRVIVVDADAQLTNPEFRAPEWLFANLLQVAGRAGRHLKEAEVIIQTRYPSHPLLTALADPSPGAHQRYWDQLLEERRSAGLPPYAHLAAVRFSHAKQDNVRDAAVACQKWCEAHSSRANLGVTVYPPTPRYPERQAGKIRWQIILECGARSGLHTLLSALGPWVQANRAAEAQVEVDPMGLA